MNTQKQWYGCRVDGGHGGRADVDERAEPRPQRTRGLLADSQVPLLRQVLGCEESPAGWRGSSVHRITRDELARRSGARDAPKPRVPIGPVNFARVRRDA